MAKLSSQIEQQANNLLPPEIWGRSSGGCYQDAFADENPDDENPADENPDIDSTDDEPINNDPVPENWRPLFPHSCNEPTDINLPERSQSLTLVTSSEILPSPDENSYPTSNTTTLDSPRRSKSLPPAAPPRSPLGLPFPDEHPLSSSKTTVPPLPAQTPERAAKCRKTSQPSSPGRCASCLHYEDADPNVSAGSLPPGKEFSPVTLSKKQQGDLETSRHYYKILGLDPNKATFELPVEVQEMWKEYKEEFCLPPNAYDEYDSSNTLDESFDQNSHSTTEIYSYSLPAPS